MHDIGKIGIPDRIMLKPGRLSEDEMAIMRRHTEIGAAILADSESEILRLAQQIAYCHHERWDGNGYPRGRAGSEIPRESRIVTISDVFDVLTSKRPYKDPYPVDVAIEMIKRERGGHFDPEITDLFMANLDQVLLIRDEFKSASSASPADFKWSERDLLDLRPEEIDRAG